MLVFMVLIGHGTIQADAPAQDDQAVTLQSGSMSVTVHPRWGGRASSLKAGDYEYVRHWTPITEGRHAGTIRGGALAGFISGSYYSAQLNTAYDIIEQTSDSLTLRYTNEFPLLEGLQETRTIRVSDRSVMLAITVTNTSNQPRSTYHRIQDWIGPGHKRGRDTVYVVPTHADREPTTFELPSAGTPMDNYYYHPAESWVALVDQVADQGLLMRVNNSPVQMTFLWGSGRNADSRTAEFFLPPQSLEPGESYAFSVEYVAFAPSSPDLGDARLDHLLVSPSVDQRLAAAADNNAASLLAAYQARMRSAHDAPAAVVHPVHTTDPALARADGSATGDLTLDSLALHATAGETATFAFMVHARQNMTNAELVLGDLVGDQHAIPASSLQARFVSPGLGLLVRDWNLSRDIPGDMGGINNDVRDAERLTPFSLDIGHAAGLFTYVRVPADTPAGEYVGQVAIEQAGRTIAHFDVRLTVHGFTLLQPRHKHYGSFFRYYLRSDDPQRDRPEAVTREVYRAALEQLKDTGYNSLVIYVSDKQDLFWVLDTCVELGWDHGTFVLIGAMNLPAEQIKARYGAYDMTLLGWGVDEPMRYVQIETAVNRYNALLKRGYTPVFTPNVPLGLVILNHLDQIVPIMALSGTGPYAFDTTRQLRQANRPAYWYNTDMSRPSIERRLIRGVYLWREPVNGILDWGEDSLHGRAGQFSVHQASGFAGTELIPTLGRENVRQALLDMRYLYTLEQHVQQAGSTADAQQAQQLLDWVRSRFHDNWHDVARSIPGPAYLDQLRLTVAQATEALARER